MAAHPLDIFQEDFNEIGLPDIHEAVKQGLREAWDPQVHGKMAQAVRVHLSNSQQIKSWMEEAHCPLDIIGAVIYYTVDARECAADGKQEQSIYHIVNSLLEGRKTDELIPWRPFLYYLCSAEQRLPTLGPKVFRRMTFTQSSTYKKVGNTVVWPAFTSLGQFVDHCVAEKGPLAHKFNTIDRF
jgi:hypothetical protein